MQRRPIIGISTQTQEAKPQDGVPACWIMSHRYVQALTSVGAVPWVIPLLQDDEQTMRYIYDQLDGLFLPGGVDVDPKSYGEERLESCGQSDPARDWAEITLVRWAIIDQKPILAVCRGIQVINVAAGGTLFQDLTTQYPRAIKHDYFPFQGRYPRDLLVHPVRIARHSRLERILSEESIQVNSMHHQGIKELASGLVPTALAPDGLIEGVEAPNGHFMVGVQWHPEELIHRDQAMRQLFTEFITAAYKFKESRVDESRVPPLV